MVKKKEKVNVRKTLKEMMVGQDNAVVFRFEDVRGTTLRNTACQLTELGMLFHINKKSNGYLIWREN